MGARRLYPELLPREDSESRINCKVWLFFFFDLRMWTEHKEIK